MTTGQMIAVGIASMLIPPIFIILHRKMTGGGVVVVSCPKCRTDLKLGRLRNYKCPRCGEEVNFFDPKTRKPLMEIKTIECSQCHQHQPKGIKFCIKCKTPLS